MGRKQAPGRCRPEACYLPRNLLSRLYGAQVGAPGKRSELKIGKAIADGSKLREVVRDDKWAAIPSP